MLRERPESVFRVLAVLFDPNGFLSETSFLYGTLIPVIHVIKIWTAKALLWSRPPDPSREREIVYNDKYINVIMVLLTH